MTESRAQVHDVLGDAWPSAGGPMGNIGDAGPASSVTLLDPMATNFRAFQSRWMTRPRNPTSDLSSHTVL